MAPPLDKSGQRYEIARLGDCCVTMRWQQDPGFAGVEFSANLKFEVFKGNDLTNCLASAQIFLRNIKRASDPDPMPPFGTDWEECMDTLAQRVEDADIDVNANEEPVSDYATRVWKYAGDGGVELGEDNGKLRVK